MAVDHIILEALQNWATENLDEESFAAAYEGEPVSHIFHASDQEDWGDSGESIDLVTSNDLYKKIEYWKSVISKFQKGSKE